MCERERYRDRYVCEREVCEEGRESVSETKYVRDREGVRERV